MEPSQVTEEKKERNWKKYFRIILIIFGVYLVFSLISFSYLIDQNQKISLKEEQASFALKLAATPTPKATPTHGPAPENWAIYKNNKYGFTIKYPHGLTFKEEDFDETMKEYHQYLLDCEKNPGCGGGRWPEFKVSFSTPDGEAIFDIDIYFNPMTLEEFIGKPSTTIKFGTSPASKSERSSLAYGVEKEGFSYTFFAIADNVYSLDTLEKIAESFEFIESKMPLACLWKPNFNTVNINDILPQYKDSYITFSGFYYEEKKNQCLKTEINISKSDKNNIPFSSIPDCETTCLNK